MMQAPLGIDIVTFIVRDIVVSACARAVVKRLGAEIQSKASLPMEQALCVEPHSL